MATSACPETRALARAWGSWTTLKTTLLKAYFEASGPLSFLTSTYLLPFTVEGSRV